MKDLFWNKSLCLAVFLIVLTLLITPASGLQTLTGTLTGANYTQDSYHLGLSVYTTQVKNISVDSIEYTTGLFITHVELDSAGTFDAGAPNGASTSFTAYAPDGGITSTGYIGYQRLWSGSTEIGGTFWMQFNTWNITGLTGTQILRLEYPASALYNATYKYSAIGSIGAGRICFGKGIDGSYAFSHIGGTYYETKAFDFTNTYIAQKNTTYIPWITGNVTKGTSGSRVYIWDVERNATVANELTVSTNTFSFSVASHVIRISALGPDGQWRNSSNLFTNGSIPTFTPTPTVTPPPGASSDFHITVKDNSDQTPINAAYVEFLFNDATDHRIMGYTNATGKIDFLECTGVDNAEFRVTKSGYQYKDFYTNFFPGDNDIQIYLYPDTTGLIPSTVNITVHALDASNGNANLANALVKVYPNYPVNGIVDWEYYVSAYTNSSGLVTFNNIQASAYNEIITTKLGYSTDTYAIGMVPLSDFTHNAYLTTAGVTPTPTPLPVSGNYTLTLSTNSVPYYGNVTATISSAADPTLALVRGINYYYSDETEDIVEFFEPGSTTLVKEYWIYGGTWNQYDKTTYDYTNPLAGIPNPDTLQFIGSGGTKTIHCTVYLTTGAFYELEGTVVVGAGSNYVSTLFYAIDGNTGAQISGPEIDIYNKNEQTWINGTYTTGRVYISSPPNALFDAYGHLAGYVDPATKLNVSSGTGGMKYRISFYLGSTPGIGNQTFHFTITDQYDTPVSAAYVVVKESGNTTTMSQYTTNGGLATFTLKQSTLYTYTVSKTGYISISGSRTTTTAAADSVYLQLRSGVQPTATLTTSPTVTPTNIPTNAAGNYTGFWGPLANGAEAAGASGTEIPIIMAGLLIFVGFIVGGWGSAAYAPATSFNLIGAESGGVFGFVLSCAFGFIPLVWVISIIIVGIFVFIFFPRGG